MIPERPYLRDGVDIYVRGDSEVHFVFLATRKRIVVKARPSLINALAWLDGQKTVSALLNQFERLHGPQSVQQFESFLFYLEQNGIVINPDWLSDADIDSRILETQQRQLSFLLDVLGTPDKVLQVQSRISNAKLVCFGVGAVGSWLIRILLGIGFRNFTLVDHADVEPTDVSRHAFFDSTDCKTLSKKVKATLGSIESQFVDANIRAFALPLTTSTNLDEIIGSDTNLVINTADEPYIGYTSVLLSRYCLLKRFPLMVAGGFDAHLASIGEMIIPGVTPCADCYADYFREALADWVPVIHPVADRSGGAGGLCSLSVFSAASAAMSVMRLFTSEEIPEGGRGEFLFDDYRLDKFMVERRADCPVCSGK